ncbi:unnamed protein product [Spodoptera exigua]|nr:unnamed protein product [Spodoptera exigua]
MCSKAEREKRQEPGGGRALGYRLVRFSSELGVSHAMYTMNVGNHLLSILQYYNIPVIKQQSTSAVEIPIVWYPLEHYSYCNIGRVCTLRYGHTDCAAPRERGDTARVLPA